MKHLIIAILIFGVSISAHANQKLIVAADHWCPYSCDPSNEKQGFVVDLIRQIFEPLGFEVQYSYLPWSRALVYLGKGQVHAVIGTSPQELPKGIFPEEEIGIYYNYFFVAADSRWRFKGIQSLENVVLGGVQDYNYLNLMPYIQKNSHNGRVVLLHGDNAVDRNLTKLMIKRIDVYVEDINVAMYTAFQKKIHDQIQIAGREGEGVPLFVGFSPAKTVSKQYADMFTQGIRKLRNSGELKAILATYGLEDWKQPD